MAHRGEVKATVTTVFVSATSLMASLCIKLVHHIKYLYSLLENLFL